MKPNQKYYQAYRIGFSLHIQTKIYTFFICINTKPIFSSKTINHIYIQDTNFIELKSAYKAENTKCKSGLNASCIFWCPLLNEINKWGGCTASSLPKMGMYFSHVFV